MPQESPHTKQVIKKQLRLQVHLLAVALVVGLIGWAQTKVDIDLGVNAGIISSTKSSASYGAHCGARLKGKWVAVGAGVEPTYWVWGEKVMVPIYGDFRFIIINRLEVLGQLGHHLYNNQARISSTLDARMVGGLYAAAGFNYYVPLGRRNLHIMAKYSEFATTLTYREHSSTTTDISVMKQRSTHSSGSLGIGVTF
jgi:hypothetical protein